MNRAVKAALLCAAAALTTPTMAAAECQWGRFHFLFGSDVPAIANADSGKPCLLRVREGRNSEFTSFTVTQQPAHGRVTVGKDAWQAWIYTSAPGFHGTDTFVGTIVGKGASFSGTSNITVTVNVQ